MKRRTKIQVYRIILNCLTWCRRMPISCRTDHRTSLVCPVMALSKYTSCERPAHSSSGYNNVSPFIDLRKVTVARIPLDPYCQAKVTRPGYRCHTFSRGATAGRAENLIRPTGLLQMGRLFPPRTQAPRLALQDRIASLEYDGDLFFHKFGCSPH